MESTKTQPIVELQQVRKEYRQGHLQVQAVNGVDLTIQEGEFTAICGPSGSGKTTLLNLIGCLDTPTEGRVLVGGRDVSALSDSALADLRLRQIGHDERDHHVEAGHDDVRARHRNALAVPHIDDAYGLLGLARGLADVFGADDHASEAQAGGIGRVIKRYVTDWCKNDAFLIELV